MNAGAAANPGEPSPVRRPLIKAVGGGGDAVIGIGGIDGDLEKRKSRK